MRFFEWIAEVVLIVLTLAVFHAVTNVGPPEKEVALVGNSSSAMAPCIIVNIDYGLEHHIFFDSTRDYEILIVNDITDNTSPIFDKYAGGTIARKGLMRYLDNYRLRRPGKFVADFDYHDQAVNEKKLRIVDLGHARGFVIVC
jgi:hypothetical protein